MLRHYQPQTSLRIQKPESPSLAEKKNRPSRQNLLLRAKRSHACKAGLARPSTTDTHRGRDTALCHPQADSVHCLAGLHGCCIAMSGVATHVGHKWRSVLPLPTPRNPQACTDKHIMPAGAAAVTSEEVQAAKVVEHALDCESQCEAQRLAYGRPAPAGIGPVLQQLL